MKIYKITLQNPLKSKVIDCFPHPRKEGILLLTAEYYYNLKETTYTTEGGDFTQYEGYAVRETYELPLNTTAEQIQKLLQDKYEEYSSLNFELFKVAKNIILT